MHTNDPNHPLDPSCPYCKEDLTWDDVKENECPHCFSQLKELAYYE